MFGKEFFPTPKNVIRKMLAPYTTGSKRHDDYLQLSILEPSAGKGDILDFIKDNYRQHGCELYCMEINPELQFILQEKGYRLLANDFLTYNGDHFFDLIVMNPPFSNGDEHLLHAWQLMEEGDIVCLLNAETIDNPYTERRKLLAKIILDHGSVERLGQVFSNSENKTNVEVVMIRLTKKSDKKKFDFDFARVTSEGGMELNEELLKNRIATNDVIGNMILQYGKLKEYYTEYLRAMEGLSFYSEGLLTQYCNFTEIIQQGHGSKQKNYNGFADAMKGQIWQVIIQKLNIQKYMTHKVRSNFAQFCKAQGALDFTKENVAALVQFIFDNRHTILESAIGEVFDIFTQYHKENRCHVEGWKTNDHWKVNRKIILPYWVTFEGRWEQLDSFSLSHSRYSEYSDIDKVMCYLSGKNFDECHTICRALEWKFKKLGNVKAGSFDGTCESQFFKLRFFKKGTLHIEFKDPWLWEEFNMRACAGKNWLPDGERKAWEKKKAAQGQEKKKPAPAPPARRLTASNELTLFA